MVIRGVSGGALLNWEGSRGRPVHSMEIQRQNVNGLELAYLETGSGPLVLMLHGFPDTAHTWQPLMQALAGAGFRAVALFQRGYDPSGMPADGDYSVLTLARDALGLMDALGEETARVIGHDWGASVAYCMANLAPDRVERLVTEAIPHPRVIKPSLKLFRKAPHFILFQTGAYGRWYARRNDLAYIDYLYAYWAPNWADPSANIAQVKQGLRKPGRLEAAIGYYTSLFRDANDRDKQKIYRAKTKVPTLAFAGASDGALDMALFDAAPAAFDGPYRLVTFEQAGHFPHCEQAEDFRREVLAFLRES